MKRAANNPGQTPQKLRIAMKSTVVHGIKPIMREVNDRPQKDDSRRQNHTGAQQSADDDFNLQVVPIMVRHRRPVTPLKIISHPSTTITAANTYRNTFSLALTSTRAPMSD